MATDIKRSRVLLIACAFATGALAIIATNFISYQGPKPTISCDPMPADLDYLGPQLTPAQIASIRPNPDWAQLKELLQTEDTVHEYSWGPQLGHVILRKGCFVGKSAEGIA